ELCNKRDYEISASREALEKALLTLLYGIDPVILSSTIPNADVSKYKLIREEVQAKNEKYRAKMKEVCEVNGGRKGVRELPRQKARGYPKLTTDRDGRIAYCKLTKPQITKIGSGEDAIKVRYDLLLKCPDEILMSKRQPNAQFQCRGQDFPPFEGGPSFSLAKCCPSMMLNQSQHCPSGEDHADLFGVEATRVFTI
ncbi:hypothetical protein OSTOST_24604, partial [Ostertagia ostertagi]